MSAKKRPRVSTTDDFLQFVLDQLSPSIPELRSRRMFGGVVIYSADSVFALVDDDVLYLKVDDTNRPDFEALGLGPFRPYDDQSQVMQFYEVPADILEDDEQLGEWAARAVAVAHRKRSRKRRPRKKT